MADPTTADERSLGPDQWGTVGDAQHKAKCGVKVIYRAIDNGELRAARLNGRGDLRILGRWIDEWLERRATPIEAPVSKGRRRGR